ncbi:MAG: hypothetical protein ABW321_30720 [Polyangiales bacterium]
MDQPLWQIWLNIALIGFVARRAAVGVALHWDQIDHALRAGYIALLAVCALAGVAVWLRARWVVATLGLVALTFTGTTLLELSEATPPAQPSAWIVTQLALALACAVALMRLAWRTEDQPQPDA